MLSVTSNETKKTKTTTLERYEHVNSVSAYVRYVCGEPVRTRGGGGGGPESTAMTSAALAGSQEGRRLTSLASH